MTGAADDAVLAVLPDEDLLLAATIQGRVLVTGNARDFDRIVRTWAALGQHHVGVIFTSPRRYPRARRSSPDDLVRALEKLLAESPPDPRDWIYWLP